MKAHKVIKQSITANYGVKAAKPIVQTQVRGQSADVKNRNPRFKVAED